MQNCPPWKADCFSPTDKSSCRFYKTDVLWLFTTANHQSLFWATLIQSASSHTIYVMPVLISSFYLPYVSRVLYCFQVSLLKGYSCTLHHVSLALSKQVNGWAGYVTRMRYTKVPTSVGNSEGSRQLERPKRRKWHDISRIGERADKGRVMKLWISYKKQAIYWLPEQVLSSHIYRMFHKSLRDFGGLYPRSQITHGG
jgi:hypothetical protein